MLYDDADSEDITSNTVMDLLEEDVEKADLVLWVGMSFKQSASLEYFRQVRKLLQGREDIVQALINPDEEAVFNIVSGSNNLDNLNIISIQAAADSILDQMVNMV